MDAAVEIRGQPPRATVIAMLAASGLPTEDLAEGRLEHFFYAGPAGFPAGLVGLELHGADALLRSLAVNERERGRGIGAALVRHAERHAASLGVRSLYLLTMTAERFFGRLGYARAERSAAPPAIRLTREFAALCPTDSAFMVKNLSSPEGA